MPIRFKTALTALALLPFASFAQAAVVVSDPFPPDKMLSETGLDQDLVQFAGGVLDAADPTLNDDASAKSSWAIVANGMFKVPDLNAQMSAALGAIRLSPADKEALKAFYESDIGKHVTALETAASLLTHEQADAATTDGKQLMPKLPVDRAKAYIEIWTAESPVGNAIARQLARAQMLATVAANADPDTTKVPWAVLDKTVDGFMPKVISSIKEDEKPFDAFVYAGLSDAEVNALVDFYKTPAAKHFMTACGTALDKVVGAELKRFGDAVLVATHGTQA